MSCSHPQPDSPNARCVPHASGWKPAPEGPRGAQLPFQTRLHHLPALSRTIMETWQCAKRTQTAFKAQTTQLNHNWIVLKRPIPRSSLWFPNISPVLLSAWAPPAAGRTQNVCPAPRIPTEKLTSFPLSIGYLSLWSYTEESSFGSINKSTFPQLGTCRLWRHAAGARLPS